MATQTKLATRITTSVILQEDDITRILKDYFVARGALPAGVRLDQVHLLDINGDALPISGFSFRWQTWGEVDPPA